MSPCGSTALGRVRPHSASRSSVSSFLRVPLLSLVTACTCGMSWESGLGHACTVLTVGPPPARCSRGPWGASTTAWRGWQMPPKLWVHGMPACPRLLAHIYLWNLKEQYLLFSLTQAKHCKLVVTLPKLCINWNQENCDVSRVRNKKQLVGFFLVLFVLLCFL